MSSLPIVLAPEGYGTPIVVVANGTPVTIADNGYGTPVYIASNGFGMPVTFDSVAEQLINLYSPTDGLALSAAGNSLVIVDSVTPANNYRGPLINADGTVNKFTFTRAGATATRVNSSGTIVSVAANLLRLDYSQLYPALLREGAATNLLLNSLLDGTNLSTQGVTVAAAAHTISFYGTGTITLSGAHVATVNGLGAYPTRTTLTFTPSAGTLTCTVSGTVQFAQVETGSLATSFIPTAGAIVTRAADVMSIDNTLFNLTTSVGTLFVENSFNGGTGVSAGGRAPIGASDGTSGNRHIIYNNSPRGALGNNGGAPQYQFSGVGSVLASGVLAKSALAYAVNDIAFVASGGAPSTDALASLPTTTRLEVGGSFLGNNALNGWVTQAAFFGARLSNAQLQAVTT